ncbi:hypothetical protein AB0B30_37365 [Streptomyces narbonensis]|uniref:Uncharacterized protein n=1 Tax=Streptomyces narbonensis TaxID=67333 RepID=A0ABV3CM14_9ACTN
MLILAAEEAGSDTWAIVGAIGALLAVPTAILVGWLAYRAVWPRRKVRWSARVSPLMSHIAANGGGLSVALSGTTLATPHIVEVELTNIGHKDLEPTHFNSLPIEITSTVPLVALLQERSEPSVQRVLPATMSSHSLTLATATPFHRGQVLTYVALVDGTDPKIELQASLTNASVDRREPPSPGTERAASTRSRWVTLAVAAPFLLVNIIVQSYDLIELIRYQVYNGW